jgi:aryl-alcohol dehydrogenase-like predicted oxidoreductase
MRKIELVKGIYSSVLGFGCAPVLGSVDAQTARKAIELAMDLGINHLDLARSYGYGQAENFVGKIIKGNRQDLVLSSKFGIKANWKARALIPVKPILRIALKKNKKQAETDDKIGLAKTVAGHFHYRIQLNSKEMIKSLEQSLKALNTDYLDYFFVHEPSDMLQDFDVLAATAQKLKEQGKIRAWGLAFMKHQEHLHSNYIKNFDILQFNNSPGMKTYEEVVKTNANKSNIFFSPLRGGEQGSMAPKDKLKKLANDFPDSVILCSMFNQQHLKENAALFNI